jgi:G:T-mismatch repair DNA endonuclease (very short patch repair protein)
VLTGTVRITCPSHGLFTQTPVNHLAGKVGCPQCSNTKSAGEDQVAAFLSNMTSVERRNRRLLRPKELDIYLPEHKLAIEYCGMYWHSHGSREEEARDKLKHVHKHEACAALGIRLITLWETDWNDRQFAIKRMLRNAIGKTKGKLMARKCELRKVSNAEARGFYDKYHPQGGAGHGEHYALFWRGKMVACMRFVHGANDRGAGAANRVWTLGRYATRINVAGAASRLFKAFVREHNPDMVKSFSDNRLFTGAMYPQLGFTLEADVVPDYQVWSTSLGLRPKSHYQRRLLQQRLRDHGLDEVFDADTDPRTEADMTYLMGARRLYDCGKKRWVWTPQT